MNNKTITINVNIKGIYKNTFTTRDTNETITIYTAMLDNGYTLPISSKAVDAIHNDVTTPLCLVNVSGKVKIDIFMFASDLMGERIFQEVYNL